MAKLVKYSFFFQFPEPLNTLSKSLRTLDISDNTIAILPKNIGGFAILKSLSIANNRLGQLPNELGSMKKLESLNLSCNRIMKIPQTFRSLSSLKQLQLSNNQLGSFPIEICILAHLDSVDLSFNKIPSLPIEIGRLHAVELNMNSNRLAKLADNLSQCPRLKVLRLQENCLSLESFTPAVLKESKISLLQIEGNTFTEKQFRELDGYEHVIKYINKRSI